MADQIIMEKTIARRIYRSLPNEEKNILSKKYGKDFFEEDLWDTIKSFEDGLAYKGLKPEDVLSIVAPYNKRFEISLHGFDKLAFLADIFRDGWEADLTNPNQDKWSAWVIYKSGSGLSFGDTGCDCSNARVASRLQFPTSEMAEKFCKQFIQYFAEYHMNK